MTQVGRPRIIQSPEEWVERVMAYKKKQDEAKEPYTITGVVLALGFATRQSLADYERRSGFSDVVKWTRLLVENSYEISLATGRVRPTGPIFVLKNMGWTDKSPEEAAEDSESWARRAVEAIAIGMATVRDESD